MDNPSTAEQHVPGQPQPLPGVPPLGHWRRWHAGPRLGRWSVKLVLFTLVIALTLYPKVWLLPEQLHRVRDFNQLIDPTHEGLSPLEAAARAALPPGEARPAQLLRAVEQVVYQRVPYAFDWDNWGVFEYLPTTAEVLARGSEDCDGRAVLAVSVLRRMDVKAWLVADMVHMWVATEAGEAMSPGKGAKTVISGEEGTRANIGWEIAVNLARGLGYGIAVFPLLRECIILAAIILLTIHPRSSGARRLAGGAALIAALVLLRWVGKSLADDPSVAEWCLVWAGAAMAFLGWLTLAIKAGDSPARSAAEQPE